MTITNIGGNMTTPFTWRISQDGTPIAQNTFQVSPGQTFNISTSGLFGTLVMDVLDTTNTVVASGSMLCQLPAPPPPAFNVSGQCGANAIGSFTITDVGGDMTLPFTWRIEQKDDRKWSLISKNTFQINAGQSTQINTKRHFGTLRLSVLDKSKAVLAKGSIVCKHSGH
jgi:hypothetical protein